MKEEKSQAELQIEAMADVFSIATTGFDEFYKQAQQKEDGDSSKSAANGNSSKSAANGDYSQSAANGNSSKSAANGHSSKSAANGNFSKSAANGHSSKSAANGNFSKSAANGDYSKSVANGDYSKSVANGDYSQSAANGNFSKSAANGDYSQSVANGDYSQSAANGYYSKSESAGKHSACSTLGYRAGVKGAIGNLLMASEYIEKNGKYIPIGGKADIVDGKKLKAGCWYIVENKEWIEVDFSDGIFTYVLSTKGRVKKVKTNKGEILFVVSDENGNSAHGKTIKKAREDLVYKIVAKFDGDLPKSATGKEWIGIYRAVTGACGAGVKMFVEQTGKSLDDTYSAQDILELVKGQYGADRFADKVNEVTK